tara:strand:- start:306 stop:545 length:240 start_codon:yes stop_codon:yes gene_type:complete
MVTVEQEEEVAMEVLAVMAATMAATEALETQVKLVPMEAVLVQIVADIQADKMVRQDQVVDLVEVQAPNTQQVTLEVLV